MNSGIYDVANMVGEHVNKTIIRLQSGSLNRGPSTSSARASIAKLRRFGMPGSGSWIATGYDVFSGLPDLNLSQRDEKRMINAVAGALRLYAYHQQSNSDSMALLEDKEENRSTSFGWSCARLKLIRPDKESGIQRRLSSIEAASDFNGFEVNARALVTQMKDAGVKIDYFRLARDLYLMQFDGFRSDVFMRWARDYYSSFQKGENDSKADAS